MVRAIHCNYSRMLYMYLEDRAANTDHCLRIPAEVDESILGGAASGCIIPSYRMVIRICFVWATDDNTSA